MIFHKLSHNSPGEWAMAPATALHSPCNVARCLFVEDALLPRGLPPTVPRGGVHQVNPHQGGDQGCAQGAWKQRGKPSTWLGKRSDFCDFHGGNDEKFQKPLEIDAGFQINMMNTLIFNRNEIRRWI